ncbi:hypothetical protein HPP92_002753 [Vanilla planifolia]|uniref:CUE domain-containing protein n=1 Tax=Vanilla planifolia TaxID=51239 RepID=A0A835SAE2_VANPL|nr:hypothetical protein HPP92_002753 [Vanilla planifolia]
MSSKPVFESLRELFPQVDSRILRAISIEHVEDINEAVEFILAEVIPTASAGTDFLGIHNTHALEQSLMDAAKVPEHIVLDDQTLPPLVLPHHGEPENIDLYSSVADEQRLCDALFQDQLISVDSNPSSGLTCKTSGYNNGWSLCMKQSTGKEDRGSVNIFQTEQCAHISDGSEFENIGLPANAQEVDQVVDKQSCQVEVETIASIFAGKSISLVELVPEKECVCRSSNLLDVVETHDALTCMDSLPGNQDEEQIFRDSTSEERKVALYYENQDSFNSDGNSVEFSSNENKDDNIFPTSLATRSGHFVSTDLLEESIYDAKNSKKTLLSSMGSIFSLMQEVESLEEKAKQASQEAFATGHDILLKVEEIKHIVKQTMDSNDMRAGEVYGERSILATEARELQSRLLRMSEEKTEHLSITEEILRALEGRLAAAKDEIAAASLEKLEREERALKALREQELAREAVVAESKRLQEEAEENSKLREFLMDRGRLVDSLQGEIAVICEDILLLKQRVDSRLPLTKSLRSSTWSFASATSTSDHQELPSSSSSLTNPESLKELKEVEKVVKSGRKPSFDDWEFFEG